uniref:Uncharacterized protein n=1 Tax=Taeniopygia guttata TaxID=59729 RepID=A0A674GID2_TAEGU
MGTVGSDRAVLIGHSAATTSHQVGCQRSLNLEQLKKAKLHVEMAVKEKKIFSVQGPYPIIRRLLRARGWVERKLLHVDPLQHPWLPAEEEEEQWDEGGTGALCPTLASSLCQSYLARDQLPNFIWTNSPEAVDCQLLQQDSMVNHYARVDAFTTKEGLCLSLQNLPWIEQADPNTFFPRCYRLGTMDDREAFIGELKAVAFPSLLVLPLLQCPVQDWLGMMPPSCRGFPPDSST